MVFNKIQELCISKGITITQLERELLMGNGTVHKWDKSSPSVDKLKKVANYFNVSMDFITGRNIQLADSQMVAGVFNSLPIEKQNLIKQYISVIQQN